MEHTSPSTPKSSMRTKLKRGGKVFFLLLAVSAAIAFGKHSVMADWRTASREPAGIAPNPADTPEAVIQVYAARAFSWRGMFGVHTWIAAKPENADSFTVYEVMGWRARYGGSAIAISNRLPDRRWFGAEPEILADLRGPKAGELIPRIEEAVQNYAYEFEYTVWPGPNSNTFVAHIARQVPELRLDLPPTAIGKDYIPGGGVAARTPSGSGFQVSFFGLLGVLVGLEEGVEVNILGLTFGVDPLDLAIKLPLAGRIGPKTVEPIITH